MESPEEPEFLQTGIWVSKLCESFLGVWGGVGVMTLWVKMLTATPTDLSAISGIHMVERGNKFHKVVLRPPRVLRRSWPCLQSMEFQGQLSRCVVFHHVAPRDCTPVAGFGCKCFYPKNHLACSNVRLLSQDSSLWAKEGPVFSLDTWLPDKNPGRNGERQHLPDSPCNHSRPVSFWSHSGTEHNGWPLQKWIPSCQSYPDTDAGLPRWQRAEVMDSNDETGNSFTGFWHSVL